MSNDPKTLAFWERAAKRRAAERQLDIMATMAYFIGMEKEERHRLVKRLELDVNLGVIPPKPVLSKEEQVANVRDVLRRLKVGR